MSTIHILSALLFVASAVMLLAAERFKDDREALSRRLALGSLVAVVGAGVLFVLDVPQIGALMDPWQKKQVVKKKGGGGAAAEDEDDDEAKDGAGQSGGGRRVSAAAGGSGGGGGKKGGAAAADSKSDSAKKDAGTADCDGCPKFVQIAPGSAMIGAEPAERLATKAERPGRKVTIWPGFAIAQRPITNAQYKRFVDATGRLTRQCARDENVPLLSKPDPDAPATCINYDDASAYAAWLSSRTGMVYRLPTAAQWEFVARGAVEPSPEDAVATPPAEKADAKPQAATQTTIQAAPSAKSQAVTQAAATQAAMAQAVPHPKPQPGLEAKPVAQPVAQANGKASGPDAADPAEMGFPVAGMKVGVVEIVLDCWSDTLEVLQDGATGRNKTDCPQRVLKGSVAGEEARWSEPWSRRPLPVAAHSKDVGFRLVRVK